MNKLKTNISPTTDHAMADHPVVWIWAAPCLSKTESTTVWYSYTFIECIGDPGGRPIMVPTERDGIIPPPEGLDETTRI